MKTLRNIHLYLGCLFAPLIMYFCLSGAWQLFRLNDLPREGTVSSTRLFLHELSKPHAHSTFPGKDPKKEKSVLFDYAAALTAILMIVTSLLGIILALRFSKRPKLIMGIIMLGIALPILFLYAVAA